MAMLLLNMKRVWKISEAGFELDEEDEEDDADKRFRESIRKSNMRLNWWGVNELSGFSWINL